MAVDYFEGVSRAAGSAPSPSASARRGGQPSPDCQATRGACGRDGHPQFDIVIENGWIVDGTGSPRFRGNVGIAGGRIIAVGDVPPRAREVVDATGMVVAPGFIDTHVHSEVALLGPPGQEASNRQGVTTHVVGQDGFGFAPTDEVSHRFMETYLSGIYGPELPLKPAGVREFLRSYDGRTTVNVATLVPHGCVRMLAVGNADTDLSSEALAAVADVTARAMEEGAIGLSTGLDYVPSMYGTVDELVALCRCVAAYGGVYVSHTRSSLGSRKAVEEAIEIGRRAGVPVHISHLSADQEGDGDEGAELLDVLDAAIAHGMDVTFDSYPYTFASTTLAIVLPGWVFEGDWPAIESRLSDPGVREKLRSAVDFSQVEWSGARLAGTLLSRYRSALGKDLITAAHEDHTDPVHFVCDLLLAHGLAVTLVWAPRDGDDSAQGLARFLRHPAHMLGSDGIYTPGRAHPRGYGAFARYVGRYVREGVLTLEEAICHVTSAPARRFGLGARGVMSPDHVADVVVFDPETYADTATVEASKRTAVGVSDVLVSGTPVIRSGVRTGATPAGGLPLAGHGGRSAS